MTKKTFYLARILNQSFINEFRQIGLTYYLRVRDEDALFAVADYHGLFLTHLPENKSNGLVVEEASLQKGCINLTANNAACRATLSPSQFSFQLDFSVFFQVENQVLLNLIFHTIRLIQEITRHSKLL